jgi:histidine triad (HIT) family protein
MTTVAHIMKECIFCRIINGTLPSYVIRETEKIVTFLALEGHPLIVPKKHIENIYDLDAQHASEIMQEAVLISRATRDVLKCEGINLIQSNGSAAGQDVFHFHAHIKPRWAKDRGVISWDMLEDTARQKIAADFSGHFTSVF